MKVAIHQPQYLPWPRYIHKIMSADVFVYLDTVQFSKNGVQNRNQVKTAKGATWLTLPVRHEFGQRINEVRLADTSATRKHWNTLIAAYSKTPGFRQWKDEIDALLCPKSDRLVDLAIASTDWLLAKLQVETRCVLASELPIDPDVQGSEMVAAVCRAVEADAYLTGTGALDYMEEADFMRQGCSVYVQTWSGLEYDQANPAAGFVPDLSTLDLVLNCPNDAADKLRASGDWKLHWDASKAR